MNNDDNIKNQERDIKYKHYKSEIAGYNFMLFLLTAVPYHIICALIFWGIKASLEVYLIFIGIHAFIGVISSVVIDSLILFSCGARDKRFFMKEEEFIIDLYLETLQKVKEAHPHLYKYFSPPDVEISAESKKLPLYIVDDININAFATISGIAISKGAINTFSHEELQGIMAHELGHFGFAAFINFLKGFMFIGTLAVTIYKYIRKYTAIEVTTKKNNIEVTTETLNIVATILDFIFLVPNYYFKIVSSITFKKNEFFADYIAILSGCGEELKNALTVIYQFELLRKYSFMDRLMITHPSTAKRIVEIERLLDTENY